MAIAMGEVMKRSALGLGVTSLSTQRDGLLVRAHAQEDTYGTILVERMLRLRSNAPGQAFELVNGISS